MRILILGSALLLVVLAVVVIAHVTSSGSGPTSPTSAPVALPETVGARATFPVSAAGARTVALTPDGATLVVGVYPPAGPTTSVTASPIVLLDARTGALRGSITADRGVLEVAVSPDGRRAYATASVSNVVDVIDLTAQRVIARVPTGQFPQGIALSSNGRTAYIANYTSGTVAVLDTASDTVRASTTVGENATEIAISPDGHTLLVGIAGGLRLLDPVTLAIVRTITLGGTYSPTAMAVSPDGRHAYIGGDAGSNSTVLLTVNLPAADTGQEIAIPGVAASLAPGARSLYVGQSALGSDGTGSFLTVDPDGRAVTSTTTIGYNPSSMVLSPDGHLLYAVDGHRGVDVVRVG